MAIQDRHRHWMGEADSLEQLWQEGRTRELYSIARIYSGKRRPAGIFFLTGPTGKHLATPEARMSEWTREFKHRFSRKKKYEEIWKSRNRSWKLST